MNQINRRELATRSRAWPSAIARALARVGVTPNQVSLASVVFAFIAHAAFGQAGHFEATTLMLVVAAAAIQLRLLCNLLDGLLAIEGELKSKTGELYNEIPDRVADILILVGAGFTLHEVSESGPVLGVAAAILAVLTAYIRLLGGSLGLTQDFGGPMAKQHRMFALTVGALAAAVEYAVRGSIWSLEIALWVIVLGTLLTLVLRTRRIARALKAR